MIDPSQFGPSAPAPQQESGDRLDPLRQALDLVRQFIASDDDEEDKLTGEKVTSLIQQLLANNQKQQDELLQGKLDSRSIRQAYGG